MLPFPLKGESFLELQADSRFDVSVLFFAGSDIRYAARSRTRLRKIKQIRQAYESANTFGVGLPVFFELWRRVPRNVADV